MMSSSHGDGMGWWMLFGGAMWVLFIIAVVFVILAVFRGISARNVSGPRPDAFEIVRGRYARGEISRDEYEQLRQDLRNGRGKVDE